MSILEKIKNEYNIYPVYKKFLERFSTDTECRLAIISIVESGHRPAPWDDPIWDIECLEEPNCSLKYIGIINGTFRPSWDDPIWLSPINKYCTIPCISLLVLMTKEPLDIPDNHPLWDYSLEEFVIVREELGDSGIINNPTIFQLLAVNNKIKFSKDSEMWKKEVYPGVSASDMYSLDTAF